MLGRKFLISCLFLSISANSSAGPLPDVLTGNWLEPLATIKDLPALCLVGLSKNGQPDVFRQLSWHIANAAILDRANGAESRQELLVNGTPGVSIALSYSPSIWARSSMQILLRKISPEHSQFRSITETDRMDVNILGLWTEQDFLRIHFLSDGPTSHEQSHLWSRPHLRPRDNPEPVREKISFIHLKTPSLPIQYSVVRHPSTNGELRPSVNLVTHDGYFAPEIVRAH